MPIEYKPKKLGYISAGNHYADLTVDRWSNLLDAALDNNITQLQNLLKDASVDDINEALLTLKQAYAICKAYYNLPAKNLGFNIWETSNSHINPQKIVTARANLLHNLLDNHHQLVKFSYDDKRIIERKLLEAVSQCNTMQQIITLYTEYKKLSILENRRHNYYDAVRNIFQTSYPTLKKNVIEALQQRALTMPSKDLLTNKDILEKDLFNPIHKKNGTSKSLLAQFSQCIAHNKQENLQGFTLQINS